MCIVYTLEYCSALKKNESLPLPTSWMDLGSIVLSEISQRRINAMTSLICGISETKELNIVG